MVQLLNLLKKSTDLKKNVETFLTAQVDKKKLRQEIMILDKQ